MRLPILLVLAVAFPAGLISAQTPHPENLNVIRQDGNTPMTYWQSLKTELQGPDGNRFFELKVKDILLPGEAHGLNGLSGVVVSSSPLDHPSEVVLALSDASTPEVTIKFVDQRGRPDRLKQAIAPGTRVAFSGVPIAYTKVPFMLTLETQITDHPEAGFALTVATRDQSPAMPVISVNHPSPTGFRFVNISLDGFPQRKLNVDHGTVAVGVLLDRFLESAGWRRDPASERFHYSVQVEGILSNLTMTDLELTTLQNQAWLVVTGSSLNPEASLIILREGSVTARVDSIQRIRVSPPQ